MLYGDTYTLRAFIEQCPLVDFPGAFGLSYINRSENEPGRSNCSWFYGRILNADWIAVRFYHYGIYGSGSILIGVSWWWQKLNNMFDGRLWPIQYSRQSHVSSLQTLLSALYTINKQWKYRHIIVLNMRLILPIRTPNPLFHHIYAALEGYQV